MPELPWEKWYAQDWYGEPSLASVDAATRGIWCDAVNIMILKGTDRIAGTIEQLARLCRCRVNQMQVAISEFKQFDVCEVQEQDGCTIIINRRRAKEQHIRDLKRKAAAARWCKPYAEPHADTHAPSVYASVSASASVPEGDGCKEGDATETVKWANLAYTAFSASPPTYPSQILLANCTQLIARGRTFSDFEAVVGWRRATINPRKPKSPETLTDPDKFDQWFTMRKEELEHHEQRSRNTGKVSRNVGTANEGKAHLFERPLAGA